MPRSQRFRFQEKRGDGAAAEAGSRRRSQAHEGLGEVCKREGSPAAACLLAHHVPPAPSTVPATHWALSKHLVTD